MKMNKVNTVGKKSFEVHLAYIAGFLDADGAIMATIEFNKQLVNKFRVRVVLKLYQLKPEVLEKIYRSFETGSINKNRSIYQLTVADQRQVIGILEKVYPYLIVKRKQAELALKILETRIDSIDTLLYVAKWADTLSRLNVRSQNRGTKYVTMIQNYFSRND